MAKSVAKSGYKGGGDELKRAAKMSDYSAPASAARNAPTLKKPSDKFLQEEPIP